MNDNWADDFLEQISGDMIVTELTKMILDTTKECGDKSKLTNNVNFRNLMTILCVFGISISNEKVRDELEDLIHFVEIEIDEADDDEVKFDQLIKQQKWWKN
jgi:hypothetical protein